VAPDYNPAVSQPVVILGPQRFRPVLAEAIEAVGVEGALAVVTAGWQEREEEVDELGEHVAREVVNLRLYGRAETVFSEDRDLFRAYRRRQDRLRRLQELYRLRLDHAMEPIRQLLARRGDADLLEPERESALAALRALDSEHLARIRSVHRAFDDEWRPRDRPAVRRQRQELADLVGRCGGIAVAGGHVAILLNRLRLFAIDELVGARPVFAWSGGAMVLGEVLVLFHDRPPQGRGNAEVLEEGLGIHRGALPLPHARHRLALDDRDRVRILARRFGDLRCLALDEGDWALWQAGEWRIERARLLQTDGSVREVEWEV
jgi:hypothetical protein